MHYQFELFNTIHIPLVIEDEYITITKIEYKTQIKGKKVPYHPELTLFKCRVNTDLDCTSLYDQMAMSLGKRTTDFDILLYKRDTRDVGFPSICLNGRSKSSTHNSNSPNSTLSSRPTIFSYAHLYLLGGSFILRNLR